MYPNPIRLIYEDNILISDIFSKKPFPSILSGQQQEADLVFAGILQKYKTWPKGK